MREYDLIAEWYASERDDQTGVPEAIALASSIPRGALVFDVGCGNGILGLALARHARRVTMVDDNLLAVRCAQAGVEINGLDNVTVEPGQTVNARFTCPAARDGGQFGEYGGAYSLYRAMAFGPDGGSKLPDVTCVP